MFQGISKGRGRHSLNLSSAGGVAKRKDGKYHIGKRTRDWLKIKAMQDEDLLICGYQSDEDG